MINVLYVSHFPDLKMGGQQSMTALIKNLNRNIFNPIVIVPSEGELADNLRSMGNKVVVIPLYALKPKYLFHNIKNIFSIRQIIRKNDIDIIHPDHERDSIISGFAKIFTKAKMVWHVRLTRSVETDPLSVKLSDGIIGIADDVKQRFNYSQSFDQKYITIYNGVDCDIFKPVKSKSELKSKLNLNNTVFMISFVGQFKTGKGIFDIIKAAKILFDKYQNKLKFKIIMVGTPVEEGIFKEMKELRKNLGLETIIEFKSQQHNIQQIMQASDVLVLPSHEGTEGMGRVLFEAMACNTPVIGTDTKGVREAITKATGILVHEKSPDELAVAIAKFMTDDEFRINAGIEGRKRALKFFDIKIHAKNVEKFYMSLFNKHK